MNSSHLSSESELSLHVLGKPQTILHTVLDSTGSSYVYFTLDNELRFASLSSSFQDLCQISPCDCLGEPIHKLLTDNDWNRQFLSWNADDSTPTESRDLYCEIQNSEGNRFGLELVRRPVVVQGRSIGSISFGRRVHRLPPAHFGKFESSGDPFRQLSEGELKVVERVIEGEMNRDIAIALKIAVRTVEARRAKAMERVGVENLAQLVKLWCRYRTSD